MHIICPGDCLFWRYSTSISEKLGDILSSLWNSLCLLWRWSRVVLLYKLVWSLCWNDISSIVTNLWRTFAGSTLKRFRIACSKVTWYAPLINCRTFWYPIAWTLSRCKILCKNGMYYFLWNTNCTDYISFWISPIIRNNIMDLTILGLQMTDLLGMCSSLRHV